MDGMRLRERKSGVYVCTSEIDIERERERSERGVLGEEHNRYTYNT